MNIIVRYCMAKRLWNDVLVDRLSSHAIGTCASNAAVAASTMLLTKAQLSALSVTDDEGR